MPTGHSIVNKPQRILLICNEAIKPNMTGPVIRYWEFANVLSKYFAVTLAVPPLVQGESLSKKMSSLFNLVICKSQAELRALVVKTDIIVTVGVNLSIYPYLIDSSKPLVVDMYIPFLLEDLQKHRHKPLQRQSAFYDGSRGSHVLQIRSADFIICASEKQKDFWLGWLGALGRINPYTYQNDPTLSKLIAVIPFGLPYKTPIQDKLVLKGVYKGITSTDKVILWGGGLWNWLDPRTLIRAMPFVLEHYPQTKLFFMGAKSPNPSTAKMNGAAEAIELSKSLGLYDEYIFFNDWVPYLERHNFLLEADIGVSLHFNHLETRFAFRTRLLDYIWTGLPCVVTEGDVLSEEVAEFNLGKVVKSGDVEQVGRALLDLLEMPNLRHHYQPNFERIRKKYEWETVMQPLIQFCEAPYFAVDKPYLKDIPLTESGISSWWSLPQKIARTARIYGLSELSRQIKEYIWWKWHK